MPTGRCAGCGFTNSSKKVQVHVLDCSDYLALFRQSPQRCLDPDAEHARYKAEEDNSTARAKRRDRRLQDRFAELERQASIQATRWQQPKDILED